MRKKKKGITEGPGGRVDACSELGKGLIRLGKSKSAQPGCHKKKFQVAHRRHAERPPGRAQAHITALATKRLLLVIVTSTTGEEGAESVHQQTVHLCVGLWLSGRALVPHV